METSDSLRGHTRPLARIVEGDGHHYADTAGITSMVEIVHSSTPYSPGFPPSQPPLLHSTPSYRSQGSTESSSSTAVAVPLIQQQQKQEEKPSLHPLSMPTTATTEGMKDDIEAEKTSTISRSGQENQEQLTDEFGREISPVPEVAAVVSNTDDPSIPCMTFRFWAMGLVSILALSFVNQFFFFRESPMVVGALVIQLLSYPLGQFMARVLPTRSYTFLGRPFSLNPGPFNIKEHVLITIMANCGAGTAYAVDIIVIQRVFYKQDFGFLANLLLILTTQLVGYGMAGILRRYLVYPAAMIWPSNLVTVALFNTLHTSESLIPGQWTRQKFFAVFSMISFCYFWIPAYIFPVITSMTLLCYINPNNVVLAQMTGANGLGIGTIALDWNTITAFLGSPLITPYWAQCNIMFGFVLIAWVMVPIAYYSDIWQAKSFPILTSKLFTTEGYFYDTLSILKEDKTLDQAMYESYGPLRIATFFAISYGVGFAGLTAIFMHTFLYHRHQIRAQWKQACGDSQDIHYKLMQAYPEVPEGWYLSLFVLTVGLAILTCEVWDYGLPWWCVFLAVSLSALFSLPIGLIQAVTNQQPGLNILTEFVIGYILPGRPIANVTFKTYGYISMSHAMSFLGDLKLGQYMKIPPRDMFMTQLLGTLLAGCVNLVTANWLLSTRPNICTPEGFPWTCPGANVFFSASVIWGVIAPARMFGPTSLYHPLMGFFLFGLLIPIPFYLLSRRFPQNPILSRIHTPVLLTSTGMMPPARPFQFANWLCVGFIFQFCVRRYRPQWYQRFNYILSAALDSGVALAALVIFFSLQMNNHSFPDWWGTDIGHCSLDKANFRGQTPINKPHVAVPTQGSVL